MRAQLPRLTFGSEPNGRLFVEWNGNDTAPIGSWGGAWTGERQVFHIVLNTTQEDLDHRSLSRPQIPQSSWHRRAPSFEGRVVHTAPGGVAEVSDRAFGSGR